MSHLSGNQSPHNQRRVPVSETPWQSRGVSGPLSSVIDPRARTWAVRNGAGLFGDVDAGAGAGAGAAAGAVAAASTAAAGFSAPLLSSPPVEILESVGFLAAGSMGLDDGGVAASAAGGAAGAGSAALLLDFDRAGLGRWGRENGEKPILMS